MHNFDMTIGTRLIFGKEQHLLVGKVIKDFGHDKVLVLYGQGSAVKTGLLNKVLTKLTEEKIGYILYGGITPNPEIEFVREARQLALDEKVDLILAIGGGSVIDVAKAVAVSVYYDGDPLDFNKRLTQPKKALPIGVILTHSSAGSEMSLSCVISDEKNNFKQGFRSDLIRPLFAITNPELTYSVNKYQTAVGIVDSLMHSLERYFSKSGSIEFADRLAEAVFITIIEAAHVLKDDLEHYEARANVMLASTISHNDMTGLGKKTSMPAHALEHALSALYPNVIHGHGLAIIWPAWARHYLKVTPEKFDQFARCVFGLTKNDKIANGRAGIDKLSEFFENLGLKTTLSSVGVKETDLVILANIATKNQTENIYHYLKPLTYEDILKIYKDCY